MDRSTFVENIKKYCAKKGVKPTVACRESGVGSSFINNIEVRGQIPSVERVQQLATYLGVTTSELLGEALPSAGGIELSGPELDFLTAYRAADGRAKDMVALALDPWLHTGEKGSKAM